ncbi:MAG: hypothetical protein ABFC90_07335 [Bacteroidales bacterium]|nr:hypothetical protein [Bacteroidales bacterium]
MKSENTYNTLVLEVIAKNYEKLKEEIKIEKQSIDVPTRNIDDVFQDTILLIAEDSKVSSFKKETEILEYFKYRYNVMRYRTVLNYLCEMKNIAKYIIEKYGKI